MNQKNYDFSFSGLKTAVLYRVKEGNYDKIEMCHEIQQAIIDVLIHKTIKAARDLRVKSIILGGGVVANDELRNQLKNTCLKWDIKHFLPAKKFCTDNGAMVAITAYFHRSKTAKNLEADSNLRI